MMWIFPVHVAVIPGVKYVYYLFVAFNVSSANVKLSVLN